MDPQSQFNKQSKKVQEKEYYFLVNGRRKARTTETTIDERWRMIGYWKCCSNQTQTATYFQVSVSAILKIINKWKLTGNVEDFSRSGRPSVQSSIIEDSITDMVYQNKYISAQEIELELDLARSTTFLIMKNMGLKYSVPSQIPQLNEIHIAKRLEYAEENKNTDIKNIIFTDESYFQLHRNSEGCWYFENDNNFTSFSKQQISFMVWAGINWSDRTQICLKESGYKFNSASYIGILDEYLIPFLEKLQKLENKMLTRSNQKQLLQVQDNAPYHQSYQTKQQLEVKQLQLLRYPPNSPDLNPIEIIWALLKKRVEKRSPKNKHEIQTYIEEEGYNMPQEQIQNCITHFKNRLNEVERLKAFY